MDDTNWVSFLFVVSRRFRVRLSEEREIQVHIGDHRKTLRERKIKVHKSKSIVNRVVKVRKSALSLLVSVSTVCVTADGSAAVPSLV